MTTIGDIRKLQQLYFDIEDVQDYSPEHLVVIIHLMKRYQQILQKLFQHSPEKFSNLFEIGLEEIVDHLKVLKNVSSGIAKERCFSDLHFYFQQSVLDTRAKLMH